MICTKEKTILYEMMLYLETEQQMQADSLLCDQYVPKFL